MRETVEDATPTAAQVYGAQLRALPAVDRLAAALDAPHPLAVEIARSVIAARRRELIAGADGADADLLTRAREQLAWAHHREGTGPRRVINATGVILHTGLGRAPLAAPARDAVAQAAEGYADLELSLDSGRRGSRHDHVAPLLAELCEAEAGIAVNNGAGAVLLAVAALAGRGGTVVVSRGQLVEIGGGFRIPEVVEQAGSRLIEVGTTNRTRIGDYARALEAHPGAIVLRVHPSNFRTLGFVEEVTIEALCELGAPVVDDLGSGALADDVPALADEPGVRRSVLAGASLVTFSGDKLLGGPQAGLLVGRREPVARAARHPLARALRIDALTLAALRSTLMLYRDPERARREIPALRMLLLDDAELQDRAGRLAAAIGPAARIVPSFGRVGGGALPLLELHGPAVAVDPGPASDENLARALRQGEPAVIVRRHEGTVLLDPRTVLDDELAQLADAVRNARASADAAPPDG